MELDTILPSRYLRSASLVTQTRSAPPLKASSSWPLQRESTPPSRRRAYLEWVEEQIEAYKESVSRAELLGVADDVVAELRVNTKGQYQLTELLLAEAVDRRIFRMLRLPTYRGWLATRPAPLPPPPSADPIEREPLPLPSAASF
jgi:hypothetical protein